MNAIIYSGSHGVMVLIPADCGLSLLEIGQKDVPAGVLFWMVDRNEFPHDVPQEAWELDEAALGEPSGIGGTYREVASND